MSRAGVKAFNRCDVKVVEFEDFVFTTAIAREKEGELITPATGIGTVKPVKAPKNGQEDGDGTTGANLYAGSGAILHCPRTEDERIDTGSAFNNHDGRLNALNSLRQMAGALLCEHCRFSTMTPVEVSIERTKFAQAEAERLEAFKLRGEAIHELVARGIPFDVSDL